MFHVGFGKEITHYAAEIERTTANKREPHHRGEGGEGGDQPRSDIKAVKKKHNSKNMEALRGTDFYHKPSLSGTKTSRGEMALGNGILIPWKTTRSWKMGTENSRTIWNRLLDLPKST